MITIVTTYADNGSNYTKEYESIEDWQYQQLHSTTLPNCVAKGAIVELDTNRVYATYFANTLICVHVILHSFL